MLLINLLSPTSPERRKATRRAYERRWRKNNPAKAAAIYKRYRDANPDYLSAEAKARATSAARERARRVPPAVQWEYNRKRSLRKYGLTVEMFDAMFEAQGRCCKICNLALTAPTYGTRNSNARACVDHIHDATGRVRALLCMKCNLSMAVVDNDEILARLIAYRDKYRSTP